MVYQNKLVVCLKVNGKVLREEKEYVSLPFGSEYSILVKNLNSVRAQVKIDIDGQDATGWVIVDPNREVTLERFIKGNLSQGNRFKFIERTGAIEEYRGVKSDDGLIRIEYAFEKKKPVVQETIHHHSHTYDPWYPYYYPHLRSQYTLNNGMNVNSTLTRSSGIGGSSRSIGGAVQNSQLSASNFCGTLGTLTETAVPTMGGDNSPNDVGITVPGSLSEQKFYSVSGFETEESEVIVLHLRGYLNNEKVSLPVTVDQKKVCLICGQKSQYKNTFCSGCGTCLNIV